MADAVIQLEARLKNFISGEIDKVQKDIRGMGGTFDSEMKKSGKAVSSFGDTFKAMVSAQLVLKGVSMAWRGLTSTVSNSLKAYDTQVKAEKLLKTALGGTTDALVKQASELQKVTLFGDEVTIAAQARLANHVKEAGAIEKLTPLVQDLAPAMNMDLGAAADLVGKSLGSSTNALSRYGIEITGAVGSNERLETAVTSLSEKFAGQAKALANEGLGPWERAMNVFGDLQEKLGEELAPTITDMSLALIDFMVEAEPVIKSFGALVSDTIKGWIYLLGIDPNDKKTEKINAINEEIVALNALKKEQQDIVTINQQRQAAGSWVDIQGLEQAQNMIEVIDGQVDELIGKGRDVFGLSPKGTGGGTPAPGGGGGAAPEAAGIETLVGGKGLGDLAKEAQESYAIIIDARGGYVDYYWETTNALAAAADLESQITEMRVQDIDELKQKNQEFYDAQIINQEEYLNNLRALSVSKRALVLQEINTQLSGASMVNRSLMEATKGRKEFLGLYKTAAIGQATIDTYKNATASYGAFDGMGPAGVALGIAAAAAAVAAGISNIQKISQAKFARGCDFVTSGPQSIMVGDNPGGRERVSITPLSSPNYEGPTTNNVGGSTFNITLNGGATQTDADMLVSALMEAERSYKLEPFKERLARRT